MKPRVVVTRNPPGDALRRVREAAEVWVWPENRPIDRMVLHTQIAEAAGLYCMLTDQVDTDLLARAPLLRVVSNMAVGFDNIDLAACAERGIAVGHTPDVLTDSTADIAWMLILGASRRMSEGIDVVRSGGWGEWNPSWLLGRDVSNTTLGIIGMGRIGRAVARRAVGFAMPILYASRSDKPDVEEATGAVRVSLRELLVRSDHVLVAVPLSAETRHLIGRDELELMKPTSNLVNIARGPIVDTDALVDALTAGVIRCAGLDVTDPEPLPSDHPLLDLPNCTVVPHTGSSTWETRAAMADVAADNLIAGLDGAPLPYRVPGT
ncbi:MAG: D-glycerate dehydrogenase [Armatimonadetes bacterium]|nr:MAG: D-glycerate dehydrogenase [Armatimonadota bacterium]